MSDRQAVSLTINGENHELLLDGAETLLVTVRERLGFARSP